MCAAPQPQSQDDNEQQPWPLTTELIKDINGPEKYSLSNYGLNSAQKREHNRRVAGMRSRGQTGCIVTVIEADGSVEFYQVKQFKIGPAE
jgi:hypothetical protein